MKKELLALLDYWEKEKGIDRNFLLDSLEKGLLLVYRKKVGLSEDVTLKINPETGDVHFQDAQGAEVSPPSFPWERIAAQTAKQVLIQKLREAEKNAIFQEFKKVEGTLISGRVERFESGHTILTFGKTEGLLPRNHQLPGDHFRVGDPITVYLLEVRKPNRGNYQLIASRTHPDFPKLLLSRQVPEIEEGLIEVKAIARFPGDITKIAVHSNNAKIDPIGTCVGDKALRIKHLTRELSGEKVEILLWTADPERFIMNSISPARGEKVILFPEKQEAVILVGDDHLFLAIGKRGQNVRLASKLTGWNIRIFRPSEYSPDKLTAAGAPYELEGIRPEVVQKICDAGYASLDALSTASVDDLVRGAGLDDATARSIIAKLHPPTAGSGPEGTTA